MTTPSDGQRRTLILCLAMITIGLGLRLWFSLCVSLPVEGDAKHYLEIAREIRLHHRFALNGELTSHRPPLYPLFLALLQTVSVSTVWVRFIQSFLSAGVLCVLLFFTIRRKADRASAVAAVALGAISPSWIYYCGVLFSETLFAFLLFLSMVLLVVALRPGDGSSPRFLLLISGFLLGLATLTRSVTLLLPPFLLGVSGCIPSLRVCLRPLLGFALAWGLTVLPWTVRNAVRFQAFIPVNTMGGIVLWQGANPSPEGFGFTPWKEIDEAAGTHDEVERNRILTRKALETYLDRPLRTLRLAALKFLWLWNPWDGETYHLGSPFNPHTFLIVFFTLYYFLSRLRRGGMETIGGSAEWVFPASILYFVFMALLFYGSPRFRMPIEPVLWFYSGLGLSEILRWKRSRREVFGVGIVGVSLLLYFFGDPARNLLRLVVNHFLRYRDFWGS